jgi:hypothetical protein
MDVWNVLIAIVRLLPEILKLADLFAKRQNKRRPKVKGKRR